MTETLTAKPLNAAELAAVFKNDTPILLENVGFPNRYAKAEPWCMVPDHLKVLSAKLGTPYPAVQFITHLTGLEGQLDALSVWIIETGTGANPSHIRFFNSAAKQYLEIASDFGNGVLAILFGTKGTTRGHSYFKPRGVKYVDANGVEKKPRAYYFECAMKRMPDGTPAWLSFIGNAMFNPTDERCTHNVGTVYGTFAGDSNWTPAAHANKQWNVKLVSLKDCCMGNDTPTSNKNVCSAAFNNSSAWKNPDVCDKYMNEVYCADDSEHTDDPACACINSPVTQYNPFCVDSKCLTVGYATANMKARDCPSVVDCSTQFQLGTVGRSVSTGDFRVEQNCGAGANTTTTPPPATGANTATTRPPQSPPPQSPPSGTNTRTPDEDEEESTPFMSNTLIWVLVGFVFVVVIAIAIMMSRRGNNNQYQQYDQYSQPQQYDQYSQPYQQPQQYSQQQYQQPQQYQPQYPQQY
jgi:hypothetical protein